MTRTPWMPKDGEPIPPELNLRCSSCGYALTGLVVRRCPECGEDFDPRETWLKNERSSWEFHFQNVRPPSMYAFYATAVLLGLAFVLLTTRSRTGWLAIVLIGPGEFYLHVDPDARPNRVRIVYLSVIVLWALVAWAFHL